MGEAANDFMDDVMGIDASKKSLFGIKVGRDLARFGEVVGPGLLYGGVDPVIAAAGGGVNAAGGGSFWEGASIGGAVTGGNPLASWQMFDQADRVKQKFKGPGEGNVAPKGPPQAAAGAPGDVAVGTDTAESDVVGEALKRRIRSGANQRIFGSNANPTSGMLGTRGTLGTGY